MAISAYKEALKLAPDMVDAHINLGNIFIEMKNVGLALQCFQAALRHHPGSAKAKKCLETAQSIQRLPEKKRPRSAVWWMSPIGSPATHDDFARYWTQRLELPNANRSRKTLDRENICQRNGRRLEGPLPQQLHRLKIAILHMDEQWTPRAARAIRHKRENAVASKPSALRE